MKGALQVPPVEYHAINGTGSEDLLYGLELARG